MTTTRKLALALVLLAGNLYAQSDVEWVGIIDSGSERKFMLQATSDKMSSGWIEIGQKFDGYALVDFDQGKELLIVKKDGAEQRLHLRDSHVQSGNAPVNPAKNAHTVEMVAKWANHAATIFRAEAHLEHGGQVYRCTEVWKATADGPHVGDIVTIVPPKQDGATPIGGPKDEIVFMDRYPFAEGSSYGEMMLFDGAPVGCPGLTLSDLRTAVEAVK